VIRSLFTFGALSALALTGGTASAQYVVAQPPPVYVQPAPVYVAPPVYATPGISAAIRLPGITIGGVYGNPYYGRPYYPAPYYGGYGYHHHYYHR
jgi:hypothetical protein